jgi:hypothetical protein
MVFALYPADWWQQFERDRAAARAHLAATLARRQSATELLAPLFEDILRTLDEICAALVDTSELSAADFNHLRACAEGQAQAFGSIRDTLAYQPDHPFACDRTSGTRQRGDQ